jgi:hypothetical protein
MVTLLSVTVALATTASAFAHDCFNPSKPVGAGVNYTVVGFGQSGPILEQTGPGQGIGGFAALSPELVGGRPASRCTRSETAVTARKGRGPGSQKPSHACDGKASTTRPPPTRVEKVVRAARRTTAAAAQMVEDKQHSQFDAAGCHAGCLGIGGDGGRVAR